MILLGSVSALPLIILLMTLAEQKQQNGKGMSGWAVAAQAAGSILDWAGNAIQQNHQNIVNADEAKKQRDWASNEALKERNFQKEMFYLDSPVERKKRLLEAGYSPWFSEQNGAGVAQSAPVPTGVSASTALAPNSGHFANLGRTIIDSNMAQSQMALNSASADKVNKDSKVSEMNAAKEFVEAYKELYSIDKDAAKRFAEASNYGFTNQGSYFHEMIDNSVREQNLELSRKNLEYQLRSKFGDKEAGTRIAEMESIINRTFGELGLMNVRAELVRSEIGLNAKRAFEIGARVANLLAQARLFSSDAAINEGIKNYVIDSYMYRTGMEGMQYDESRADFSSRSKVRDWKLTDESKSRQLWNYKQSPEGNYVNSMLNGFTNSANVSFGASYNFNRSKSNTFSRGINDSRIFNMGNW